MATSYEAGRRADHLLGYEPQGPGQLEPTHRRSSLIGRNVNVGRNERLVSLAAGSILALLGAARRDLPGLFVATVGGGLVLRGATGHCSVYDALDIDTADGRAGTAREAQRGVHLTQALLIDKSPEELYSYWRNLENLPRIMTHLDAVRVIDERRSHWVARMTGMLGRQIEWDAEIVDEQPNRRIAWRSLPGAVVAHQGSVEFVPAPGDRGTAMRVVMDYRPPMGQIGRLAAKLFDKVLSGGIREDLRNFKRTMEVGEILTTEGQPRGTCYGLGKSSG